MNIALLSVGTEILLGDTVNTNLSSLGQILHDNGYILTTEITVPDNKELIQKATQDLLNGHDIVVTCGGIGPTEDDFTKEVISELLDLELLVDNEHLQWMKSRWESRGLTMPVTNAKQAEIPKGARKLENTTGTSPGIYIEHNKKHIFIFPGPPREFIPLVSDELVPFLKENYSTSDKDYQFILFFNQAESALAEQIDEFKPEGLDIAYLASKGVIKLRIDVNSVTSTEYDQFKAKIDDKLSEYILSYQNAPASKVLLDNLKDSELSITLVESITGGALSSEIVKHPGASKVLVASNVVYDASAKKQLTEKDVNDDWVQLTEDLSIAALNKSNADISLAVLGEAGPIPSSKYKVGEIFISITSKGKTVNLKHNLRGNRQEIINRAVNNCIWDLLNFIK